MFKVFTSRASTAFVTSQKTRPTVILSAVLASVLMAGSLGVVTAPLISSPAVAQSVSAKSIVDQAILDGVVGETASGYLGLVKGSADLKITNAMNEVNIGRKTVYTRLARAQNVSVDVVAALTGEKQLAKAAPGTFIYTKSGVWTQVR